MKIRSFGAAFTVGLLITSGMAAGATGKAIYDTTCAACHGTGAAGAPKLGDKAAWAPRLKDLAVAKASALNGKGFMPAKGGNSNLSKADVIAAVDYIAERSK
ncbi:MAG TPA: c-type cytochrome [Noviherbaspirillum sp.]|nr:c-type cytochrome [Noviherbaspirillum sp.]